MMKVKTMKNNQMISTTIRYKADLEGAHLMMMMTNQEEEEGKEDNWRWKNLMFLIKICGIGWKSSTACRRTIPPLVQLWMEKF